MTSSHARMLSVCLIARNEDPGQGREANTSHCGSELNPTLASIAAPAAAMRST